MKTYANQNAWRELNALMPAKHRLMDDFLPQEEWLDWQGHRVHLDCYRNENAPAKIILLHGVGTNGRQMQMVLGHFLAKQGFETIAIDMPTYGMTQVNPHKTVVYDDWIELGSAYIDVEKQKDNRPIFLYGLSAGGMETYDVAAKNGKVAGIIGMTFLDTKNQAVRDTTAFNLLTSRVVVPLLPYLVKMGLGKMTIPMRLACKMSLLCNHKQAMKVFFKDKTSAGNRASYAFLNSYMFHELITPPEQFGVCPVLLTQPAADGWTPLELSQPFLARIKQVPVKTVMLPNGGHYPMEEDALDVLHAAVLDFIQGVLANKI